MKHQLMLKNTATKQFNAKNAKNSGTWPGNADQITSAKFAPKNTLQKRINTISIKFRIMYAHILPSNALIAEKTIEQIQRNFKYSKFGNPRSSNNEYL